MTERRVNVELSVGGPPAIRACLSGALFNDSPQKRRRAGKGGTLGPRARGQGTLGSERTGRLDHWNQILWFFLVSWVKFSH